jgi:hypothetical protein
MRDVGFICWRRRFLGLLVLDLIGIARDTKGTENMFDVAVSLGNETVSL